VFVVNWRRRWGAGVNFKPPKGAGDVPVPPVVGRPTAWASGCQIGGGSAAMLRRRRRWRGGAGRGAITHVVLCGEARERSTSPTSAHQALRLARAIYELIAANKQAGRRGGGRRADREESAATFAAMKAPGRDAAKVLDEQRQAPVAEARRRLLRHAAIERSTQHLRVWASRA
jgi:hypothetical protein